MLQVLAHARDRHMRHYYYATYLLQLHLPRSAYHPSFKPHPMLAIPLGLRRDPIIKLNSILAQKLDTRGVNLMDLYLTVKAKCFEHRIKFLCPMADLLPHSRTPNSTLRGVYVKELRKSMIVLRTIKEVGRNEPFTISKGLISHIDMFMENGVTTRNDPNTTVLVSLNFGNVSHYLSFAAELKQRLLASIGNLKTCFLVNSNGVGK